MKQELTVERLRELLHYDPGTGVFLWKVQRGGKALAGTAAGTRRLGDWSIGIEGVVYSAHRLAWLYVKGCWPERLIDHKDGDCYNNIFTNLREATYNQNAYNQQHPRVNNTSGIRGVCWNKECQKWQVRIQVENKSHNLGLFSNIEEATAARQAKARELHGEFYSG